MDAVMTRDMRRLCELRDGLRKTSVGREYLAEVCERLTAVQEVFSSGFFMAQQMELDRVKAERDAAVSDLKRAAEMFGFCDFCDNVRQHMDTDMEHRCRTCRGHKNYAWRTHT